MGTVIKADGVGRIKKHLATLGLKDHMAEAQRVVHDARVHALEITEGAHSEIVKRGEDARRAGYERGFREGRSAGEESGHKESFATSKAEFLEQQKSLLGALDRLMGSFEDRKGALLDRARHDVLQFAVSLAERIVKRTVAVDRQVAVENATAALRQITDGSDVVIRVNPADMAAMRAFADADARKVSVRRHVALVEDEAVGAGGCLVESNATSIDATLEGQLRHARALLLPETGLNVSEGDRSGEA